MTTYLDRVRSALDQIPTEKVAWLIDQLKGVQKRGSSVYVLGNGGSDSLAQHLVLTLRGAGIRAIDLMADTAWVTATANDFGYQTVAIALLDVFWKPKDMLLVISGGGESENIKAAVRLVAALHGRCAGVLGNGGGGVLPYCTDAIVLPGLDYGPLEDTFSVVMHMIGEGLKGDS